MNKKVFFLAIFCIASSAALRSAWAPDEDLFNEGTEPSSPSYTPPDYDYELELGDAYTPSKDESASGTVEFGGIDYELHSLSAYVEVNHGEPDSGTKKTGSVGCDSGYAISKIKIRKTLWKSFTTGISYMEVYCAPYTADGKVDMDAQVEAGHFGYDDGDSESVDCGGFAIAGVMYDEDDDHLGVVCQDAYITNDYSAVAGLTLGGSAQEGYGLNNDYYSLSFDVEHVGALWTENDSQDYVSTRDASWCIQDYNGLTFSSAGAMTGLVYKYQRSKESDCYATCDDNGLVFYLHAYCHEAAVKTIAPNCGDDKIQGTEECDNGSSNSNTGACTADCKNAVCGDEYTWSGHEECDDGNKSNTDWCTNKCEDAVCGDGHLRGGSDEKIGPPDIKDKLEEKIIDKGDTKFKIMLNSPDRPFFSPISTAFAAPATDITSGPSGSLSPSPYADDTLPSPPDDSLSVPYEDEECDDGNNADNDGCNSECEKEYCGDGVKQSTEACDDGNTTDGDGCSATCAVEPDEGCDECGECGDGTLDPGEECDDGNNTNSDGCSSCCDIEKCGDALQQTSEECDDGNTASGDGCSSTCTDEHICGDGVTDTGEECDSGVHNSDTTADACRTTCVKDKCGDKVVDSDEQCDDGNTTAGDGCDATCFNEKTVTPACGDGILQSGEDCDNGSTNSDTTADACRSDCRSASCGDSVVDTAAGEACDNGGKNSNTAADACRTDCAKAKCGDSAVDTGEECDDGGADAGDGCDASCKNEVTPACGDGILQSGEDCDNGSTNSDTTADACRTACKAASCGDNVVDIEAGETCDDGNTSDGDGCSSVCQAEVSGEASIGECTDAAGNAVSFDKNAVTPAITISDVLAMQDGKTLEVSAGGITYYVTYEKKSSGGGEARGTLKFSPASLATVTADGETPEVVYCETAEAGIAFGGAGCKCSMTGDGRVTMANLMSLFGWMVMAVLPYALLRRRTVRTKK